MATIKISSKVEENVWNDFREMSKESHQSISGLLTEAIQEYMDKRRIRPEVESHLKDSINANKDLGKLLAK